MQRSQIFVQNRVFCLPTCIRRPRWGFPSKYRHPAWYGKTRMVWLPDGEKISKICLFVLTWSTNVRDGRTDRQTDTTRRHRPRLCIAWQKLTNLNEKWRYSLDNSDSIHLIQFVYCLNIFCQQPCKVNICKSDVSAIGFTVEDKRYVKMADD